MKKILVVIIAIVSLVYLMKNLVFANLLDNEQKIIYIDPGHGGIDGGATDGNIKESDINLKISLYLRDIIEQFGYKVYLTRDGDYDLASEDSSNRKKEDIYKRVDLINESNALAYISIHCNAIHSSIWSGSQTFYSDNNTNNAKLAKEMQMSLKTNLNTTREQKTITGKYLVDNISITGVLVEVGFLSNPEEAMLLNDSTYQNKVALTIFSGLENYLLNVI